MRFSLPILAALLLLLTATFSQAGEPDKMAQADALLQNPGLTLPQAKQALALYEEQLRRGGDRLSLLPRLARTAFIVGDLAPKAERAGYYNRGLAFAESLSKAQPGGVAGHYWQALNMCGLADVGSRFQGFRLLPKIIAELQQSLALDESYDQAGAHRVLGRIYYEAPGRPFSVGDLDKSRRHLTAAVRLAPGNSTNHLYLAETLLKMGHQTQAREELQQVLQARRHAIRTQGLVEDQAEARRLLAEASSGE